LWEFKEHHSFYKVVFYVSILLMIGRSFLSGFYSTEKCNAETKSDTSKTKYSIFRKSTKYDVSITQSGETDIFNNKQDRVPAKQLQDES